MSFWHIILSIGVIAVAVIIGYAISKARKKKPEDEHLSHGVTFEKPQQEGNQQRGPSSERKEPRAKAGDESERG